MENQFTERVSNSTTEELIELYKEELKGKNYLGSELFELVKIELTKREMAFEQLSSNQSNSSAKWYDDWSSFMFTVALSVAIGVLVAAFIIYLILRNEISRSF